MSEEIAAGPTELEMHRLAYKMIQAAGFQQPEELLAAYKRLEETHQRTIAALNETRQKLAHSDRLLGEATREVVYYKNSYDLNRDWLRKAKRDAGYDENVSFDVIWDRALGLLNDNPLP